MKPTLRTFLYDNNSTEKKLKAASVVMGCDMNPVVNRAKMIHWVKSIVQDYPLVELVFFGEVILSWYNPDKRPELHQGSAETIPGETTDVLCKLAAEHEIYLCFGISERSGTQLHNTQVLINPHGEIQAVHRKKRLKEDIYQPGELAFTQTEIKGIKTAILICADAADPETMLALMKSKPELILLSLADDKDENRFMAKSSARLYDAWIITANRVGWEDESYWNGHAGISNPLGELCLIGQDQEGPLVYDLKFARHDPLLKRILRKIIVRTPLIWHVIKHWKQIRSYY